MLSTSRISAAVAVAAGLAGPALAPAVGHAAQVTFGSDLIAPADAAEARQADTAYWQTSFADGRSPLAPASGQITSFRIKGIALSEPVAGVPGGETMFHLQALRNRGDGTFQILRSSQAFHVPPRTAHPQTVTTYVPENFCVAAGDVLAFNTVGGWDGVIGDMQRPSLYPRGTPLQIFSGNGNAVVSEFLGADRTNNGDILSAQRTLPRELLMQMTVGTAQDATALCPGGLIGAAPAPGPPAPPPAVRIQKVTIPAKQRVTVSKKGKLTVSLFCLPGASGCTGHVRVLKARGKAVSLGARRFDIGAKQPGRATIFLNKTGRRLFKRGKGRLAVRIVAETRPGGAERTSTLRVTLRKRASART